MKRAVFLVAALSALGAFAEPTVSVVSMTQDAVTRVVTVGYTLDGGDAIVTCEMFADGVRVAGIPHLAGEINRKLPTGTHAFTWVPGRDFDAKVAEGGMSVKVNAWALDNPPDYMVVDILPPNAIRYYERAEDLPGGVRNEEYKLTSFLLRRIPATDVVWMMGAPAKEPGQTNANAEFRHRVKFTSDYYMGVYPVTQRQYSLVFTNAAPFNFKNDATYPNRRLFPAEGTTYVALRGPTASYNWPADVSHDVATESFFGYLRRASGLDFDLPTDAQWEYACRAGAAEGLYSGKDYSEENLKPLAWFRTSENPPGSPQPVGLKEPNAWGLYDMLGNTFEWCLDWYKEKLAPVVEPEENPVGPLQADSTGNRVLRGGSYTAAGDRARSAYRYNYNAPEKGSVQTGFRLWAPALAK